MNARWPDFLETNTIGTVVRRRLVFFFVGLVTGPLVGLVLLYFGLWPWRGTSPPARWENALARKALHTAVRREAANLHPPLQPDNDTLIAGMKIYRANCAGCHGDFGQPSVWGTGGFYPRVPQFADAPPSLRPEEMFVIVRNGVRYTGMGAWKDLMPEEDTWKVVLFLSSLRALPPEVRSGWEAKHQ